MTTAATTSTRQQILEVVRTRLCAIRKTAGFQTDAGKLLFLEEAPTLGPDDPDEALAIVVGDDSGARWSGEQVLIELPIGVQAVAKASLVEPWRTVEAVIADIKKAMELEDRSLGKLLRSRLERGVTRTLPRQEGTDIVGAEVEYRAPYVEVWGRP